MLKEFINIVFNKAFFVNTIIVVCFSLIGLMTLNFYLDKYTLHDMEITVPDLKDYSMEEMEPILENRRLRFSILDSSYVKGKAPNVILDQNPVPGSKVKENRQIYLTVNAKNPPKVKLPNVLDQSHRIAIEQLKVVGLSTDSLVYRPHFARDAVIGVLYEGKKIKEGIDLIKGSSLTLIVGMGTSKERVNVPALKGLTIDQADELLMSNSLNLGRIKYDDTIEDTITAQIINQWPKDTLDDGSKTKLNLGSVINIWVTQEVVLDSTDTDDGNVDSNK